MNIEANVKNLNFIDKLLTFCYKLNNNMVTVPEIVKDLVKHSPFLEEALAQDIVNLSALARQLKPQIEKKLMKKTELGAVIMALKRLTKILEGNKKNSYEFLKQINDITVRSNLVEFTYLNSPTLIDKQAKLLHEVEREKSLVVTFTEGVFETTIFVSLPVEEKVEQIFKGEALKSKIRDLSSITLILPQELVYVPGVYYSILKVLAWQGISFVEVISSLTELTIFLEKQNVDRAFSALKNLS